MRLKLRVYLDRSRDIPQSKYVLQRKYVLLSAVSPDLVTVSAE